ncbi:hypothetical protein BYT27DRAFT_7204157 [Phlegmacium glaucopus]|nr:hypothetical protein BYT27DRAFT_7204157 [Phlegmacium glaucopus]
MSSTVRIDLAPKAGFCIKSSSLTPTVLPPPLPSPSSKKLLEPTPGPIPVPKGLKIFINIAWDPHVPPPPEGNEDAIRRAMQGEDVDEKDPSAWYVPVIVSNARQDTDKSGKPSIVFDCIYNPTVKSRTLRDPDFKLFIVELALQRIESQSGLNLSREIATPNIASKGKLLPRSVHIPASTMAAFTGAQTPAPSSTSFPDIGVGKATNGKAPLIQDISQTNGSNDTSTEPTSKKSAGKPSGSLPGLRGIMKNSSSTVSKLPPPQNFNPNAPLDWSWTKEDSGRLRIQVNVPALTRALVQSSSLDMEPRRLTLSIPTRRTLDIDLTPSDAEIVSRISSSINAAAQTLPPRKPLSDSQETRRDQETSHTLQLKRQRDFDVDGAEAQWKVGSEVVVIYL